MRTLRWLTNAIFSRVPLITVLSLLFLGVALSSISSGLAETVRGLGSRLLLAVSLGGLLLAWLAGGIRRSVALWMGLLWLAGVAAIIFHLGKLGDEVALFGWGIDHLLRQTEGFPLPLLDGGPLWSTAAIFWEALSIILIRLWQWITGWIQGSALFDPVAVTFAWATACWTGALWAGWSGRRQYSPLASLLPSVLLLVTTLAYVRAATTSVIFLLVAILLQALILAHLRREQRWDQERMDYSPELRFDLTMIGLPLVILLVWVAYISPSITIKSITEAIQRWTNADEVRPAEGENPLGLEPEQKPVSADAFKDIRLPGLPRDHLIGSGPELSRRVVMTVTTGELPIVPILYADSLVIPRHYWRSVTYNRYNGRGWGTTGTFERSLEAGDPLIDEKPGYRSLNQTFEFREDPGGNLYYSGQLVEVDQPFNAAFRGREDLFAANLTAETYTAQSLVPDFPRSDLRNAPREYPVDRFGPYLQLPDTVTDRVRNLALEITADARTPYDQAKAIEAYLRQFPYTTDLPAPPDNKDIADYFLFELQTGYCDYYSTTMVVMARAIGLPARLVMGYAPGYYESTTGRYIVTEADAHSWPEIYFVGYGWVEFEPTGSRPALEEEQETEVEALVEAQPTLPPSSPSPTWFSLGSILPFVLILAAVIGLSWLAWGPSINRARLRRRSSEQISMWLYENLLAAAHKQLQMPRSAALTPYETGEWIANTLAERLDLPGKATRASLARRPALERIINLYVQAIYSPHPPAKTDALTALATWDSLQVDFRRARWQQIQKSLLRRVGFHPQPVSG